MISRTDIKKIIIYTDGGSRGNPGPAAIGVVIENSKEEIIKKYSEPIGEATNNEAEYQAVIFALKKIKALWGKEKAKNMETEIRIDSELVVNHLNHKYKIKEENLQPLFLQVWNLVLDFKKIIFVSISREENTITDKLVNQALDNKEKNQLLF